MIEFNPPELRQQIAEAIRRLTSATGREINDFSDEIINVADSQFDPAMCPDKVLTCETELLLELPDADCDRPLTRTYGEFVALIAELESASVSEILGVRTKNRVLTRVSPIGYEVHERLADTFPEPETQQEKEIYDQVAELTKKEYELRRQCGEYERAHPSAIAEGTSEWRGLLEQYRDIAAEKRRVSTRINRPFDRFFLQELDVNGQVVLCSLTRGLTVYSLLMLAEGNYDKDFDPPGDDDDLFIELRTDGDCSEEGLDNVIQAFMFELSSDLGIHLDLDLPHDVELRELDDRPPKGVSTRLRPLLIGKGLSEPLRLYNQAIRATDSEVQILLLAKVIEHVSHTVVRQNLIQTLRSKLFSPQALEPDARYIIELAALVEEQRSFGKDREAIKLTVRTCCDVGELAKFAPRYLKELRQISVESKQPDRDKAIEKFGVSLADTRNSIAHAKSNYTPTGNECPRDQCDDFLRCVELAAQQVIRWYHTQSEINRVI